MGRIDVFTIVIVAICLAAAAALIVVGVNKFKNKPNELTINDPDPTYVESEDDGFENYTNLLDSTVIEEEPDDLNWLDEDKEDTNTATATTPSRVATSSSYSDYGDYMVLAGTFSVKSNAENYAKKIKGMGYESTRVEIFDKGTYAVVLVDRFDNEADARKLIQSLKTDDNIDAYLKIKK